ncbi:MAG: hypothetical protein LBK63_12365 [Treponema sp.]|nr:hypothetical protein [Treponema sp.]
MREDKQQTPETGRQAEHPGNAPHSFEPDRELVFYYNRERRLGRSSADVRALNEGRLRIQGGVIRSLTSTKPHLLLFISIVIIFAGIMVFSSLPGSRSGLTLAGNTLRVSASGGPKPCVILKKTLVPGEEAPYAGAVYVGISPLLKSLGKTDPADIPVFTDQIFFTLEEEEEYRFDLPFSAENYLLLLQAGEGDQRVSARVNAGK